MFTRISELGVIGGWGYTSTQSMSGALCIHGKDPKEMSPQLQQPEQWYLSELVIYLLSILKLMIARLSQAMW